MTQSHRIALVLFVIFAAASALAQSEAQKSFDQLKSLAGTWEGKNKQNQPLQVTFRVTSEGSALMSEIIAPKEDMITIFHMNGPDKLMLTHYCAAGNQPRMQAKTSPDGKTISFDFLDATNLPTPDAGHMQRVTIAVHDANHHTEEWTFVDHGKEMKEVFNLHRKS